MKIPSVINAADSVSWLDDATTDNLGNPIAPPSWSLTYIINGATTLTLSGVQSGTGWVTSITSAQSTNLTAGTYYWQAFATNGSSRVTLGAGQLQVKANLAAAAANFDGRSQARKDLDAVQSAIRSMISGGGVQEYTIGNRSIRKMSVESLLMLETKLKHEVAREERAQRMKSGLGDPNNLYVRFK